MSTWEKIATVTDLREGRPLVRVILGEEIALFMIHGKPHAITNVCPHQHAPVLAEGILEGTHISCPMHGWKFDIATGRGVEASGRLDTYETQIIGKDILICIPDDDDVEHPW